MIERVDGLGFSLKPPAWLRAAVGSIVKGQPASVPIPGTPGVIITPQNQPQPSPVDQVNQTVTEKVPGGWATIAVGAALAFFVLPKLLKGRRG